MSLPLADISGGTDWKGTPADQVKNVRRRFCLRALAQGACTCANICEHCATFHAEPGSLSILAAQHVDAEALAKDAENRGWIAEAERRRELIARLNNLISEAQAG
ncbi:transposase [Microbispora sp. H10949]|uniref:transposase n=1 Tax=Microbispora sp. H10949 TaxID=2729111 RepID=UPI0016015524|nr:transposase [Microbispora sp. H10949]